MEIWPFKKGGKTNFKTVFCIIITAISHLWAGNWRAYWKFCCRIGQSINLYWANVYVNSVLNFKLLLKWIQLFILAFLVCFRFSLVRFGNARTVNTKSDKISTVRLKVCVCCSISSYVYSHRKSAHEGNRRIEREKENKNDRECKKVRTKSVPDSI